MARPAATPEQRKEQRNRIRRAASEIYEEGGLPALSVRAVAARAEISTGLLYSYFANMSDLMRSIWMRPVAEFGREAESIAAATPDPVERIEKLLTAFWHWAEAHADVYRGVLLFVRPPTSPTPDRQDIDQLVLYDSLRTAIEEGQALGRIRAGDSSEFAHVLWAGIHGAIGLPINIDTYAVSPTTVLAPAMISALLHSLVLPDPSEGTA